MKRSTDRILTTHVGSLARPTELLDVLKERENGRPYDPDKLAQLITAAVADRVEHQVESGVDIVTDGEMSKTSFIDYVKDRLAGFEIDESNHRSTAPTWQAEIDMFPEYYEGYLKKYAATVAPLRRIKCTGPISYAGQEALQTDIANLKAAVEGKDVTEVFMPATTPGSYGSNEYYSDRDEYLEAVANAMREEYLGIIEAGFLLQIDDPGLIDTLGDPSKPVEQRHQEANETIDTLNHALRDIPIDKIRHHTCYGLNHGPRLTDVDMFDVVPFLLRINAGAYSFEVANPRHMHEWHIWEHYDLPDEKILLPGLLGHANNYVEHPELIAEYIMNYAGLVGKDRVIASTDCGFSSRASYAPEVHPTVVWPKFKALAEGAQIASAKLWK